MAINKQSFNQLVLDSLERMENRQISMDEKLDMVRKECDQKAAAAKSYVDQSINSLKYEAAERHGEMKKQAEFDVKAAKKVAKAWGLAGGVVSALFGGAWELWKAHHGIK